jgi:hypothetical protein
VVWAEAVVLCVCSEVVERSDWMRRQLRFTCLDCRVVEFLLFIKRELVHYLVSPNAIVITHPTTLGRHGG